MKKALLFSALACASLNAAAYFDGGVGVTGGPDGYRGSDLYFMVGGGNIWVRPALATYTSDSLDKTFRTYKVRGGFEADMYTLAGELGTTPGVASPVGGKYSNNFIGGDVTVSLTPGAGGKGRLAGPNARGGSRGGQGITRIDVGAGIKYTEHQIKGAANTVSSLSTGQTAYSLFAGAKVLVLQLGASYTAYKYAGVKALPLISEAPGLSFPLSWFPDSSVNVRADITGYPMVTPFVGYTATKFKTVSALKPDNSSAYTFGASVDLSMIDATIAYQIYDNGSDKDKFLTVGAGLRF